MDSKNHVDNPLTLGVSFLTMKFGGTDLSTGSGFFWVKDDRKYLITNWHNVSGRDPSSGAPLSRTAGIPDSLTFTLFARSMTPADPGRFVAVPATASVSLLDKNGKRLWIEHPVYGARVDVVAIPILNLPYPTAHLTFANQLYPDIKVQPRASQDAFVVGFPLGVIAQLPIPIWKRATIATEPAVDIDSLPKLLVDTASRKGMSGSVVLADHFILGPYTLADGTEMAQSMISRRQTILGVYSGRLGADHVQAQLGIVWKKSVIDEIIAAAGHPWNT